MKILHVIPAVSPRYGGPSSSIVEMCRALRGVGVSPTIATTDADGSSTLDVPLGTSVSWDGVDAIFFRRQWGEAFKYSNGLARWLHAHVAGFDVIHVHAPLSHASLAAGRAARRRCIPYVVRPLGTLDAWSLRQKALKKKLLLPLAARLLRGAAAVHYTSTEEMTQVQQWLGQTPGVVIPLGVDPALLAAAALSDEARAPERYVLALSRLHPVKNLEALVEAFADLEASGHRGNWRLVIAGDGDVEYMQRLDAAIARRGSGAYITRRPWIAGEAKHDLVRRASVFALPSHHENFGVGLIEAMAAGVPVLVSRGVHLASVVEANRAGWVTEVTPDSIHDALRQAVTGHDRSLRGAAAREAARPFAWPAVASTMVDLYDRILARGARTADAVPVVERARTASSVSSVKH
jgi:glycosyltransferase involved in cell wall biosynthesis